MKLFKKNSPAMVIAFAVIFTIALSFSVCHAQTCGVICAMKERAAVITQMKNTFVVKVLTQYQIPFHSNAEGVIVQIQVSDKWHDVENIDIVPETKESPQGIQVTGHNIYFHTKAGILHLTSAIDIKR